MRVPGKFGALCVAAGAMLLMAACVPDTGGGGGPANQAPTASFSFSPDNQYAPVTVNFNGSASSDDSGIVDYSWSFGDASPDVNGPTATTAHTYITGGSFPVTLTVKDAQGATGTTSLTVTVQAHVDADGDGFFGDIDDCVDSDNSIYPGAPDTFGDGIDQNCDTVDGSATTVIFVNKNGSDTPPIGDAACGLAPTTACRQITTGLAAAVSQSRPNVYVSGGSFNAFSMTDGISLYGNFGSANWKRGGAATGDATTIVTAATNAAVAGGTVGVIASNISSATVIDGLTVAGVNAAAGTSAYGIVSANSTNALSLANITVDAAKGGDGANGANGASASGSAPATAQSGENSEEAGTSGCLPKATARKAGGTTGGADGGLGGQQDTDCFNYDATAGLAGANAAGAGGGYGGGGAGGGSSNTNCVLFCNQNDYSNPGRGNGYGANGGNGQPGKTTDATAAAGGVASNGTVSGGLWAPAPAANGANGGLGLDGTGGGGGGGGGGSDYSNDDMGAGGGAGGLGGAKAPAAGVKGTAGAASVGILLTNSSPVLSNVVVNLGNGGKGGNGGLGGLGQPGGLGGAGGMQDCNSSTGYANYPRGTCPTQSGQGGGGGNGGNGGRGGHASGGGGAAGGPAFGIVKNSSTTSTGSVTFSGGAGGAAGSGGSTGITGGNGAAGPIANVATL